MYLTATDTEIRKPATNHKMSEKRRKNENVLMEMF